MKPTPEHRDDYQACGMFDVVLLLSAAEAGLALVVGFWLWVAV